MSSSSRSLYITVLERCSLNHPLSIQLFALCSLVPLVCVLLFSLAPWFDDESLRHVSEFQDSIAIESNSFTVDHFVVFIAILPPTIWLLLVHIAYSELNFALQFLRVTNCLTVSFALTVLLAEFLSSRAMIALLALMYALLGLMYSWCVPIWRWYQEEARRKGLVGFLPQFMQKLLLQTSLLEWLTDTSLSDKLAPVLPFLLPLTRAEQMRLMEQMSPESQVMMTKPGLMPLLPDLVQKVLLPVQDSDSDGSSHKKGEEVNASASTMEQNQVLTSPISTTAGFDFHRPDVVGSVRTLPSREQVLNEIMTSWVWNGCKKLMKVPTAKVLNRTAAMSSALLVMQLYASRRSRTFCLALVQLVAASALSSVACCAIFLRLVQYLDTTWTSGRAMPLLRYARYYLLRHGNAGIFQVSDQPAHGVSMMLRSTASSVSIVLAMVYLLRKLRR
ncbi:unnamed protein product [Peronospora belbahrii]|uniref:Transmembrane protein n=1 Tax=Peronospora belbahrii TaxID=622444 RepID=A0AAU9KSG3_9STRA|nr:unnamed protein product [Peronospora belbahrii]CAH0516223.1 unnamed protein product [Peronospora belbahrii]